MKFDFKKTVTGTLAISPSRTSQRSRTAPSTPKEGAGDEIIALSRGLTLLRRVAAADGPISNGELAELTGIPKPTVSRITATLVSAGFLFQLPDSERFVLTASVLELSNGFLRNFDIRARARPFLTELAERTSLSVHLAARDRLDMVVIETIRPRSAILVSRLEVGSRIDLARTAVGRAYLAALPDSERNALISGLQAALGNDWPHIHARLAASVDETRARGFAIATGAWCSEWNAIATPSIAAARRICARTNGWSSVRRRCCWNASSASSEKSAARRTGGSWIDGNRLSLVVRQAARVTHTRLSHTAATP